MFYRTKKELYVFLYETKEDALHAQENWSHAVAAQTVVYSEAWVIEAAKYWSQKLKKRVTYSKPNDIFFLISEEDAKNNNNQDLKIMNFIVGDKYGWVAAPSWLKMEEINE